VTSSLFIDFGSPYAYLAAERAERVLAGELRWCPVLLGALFKATGRSSWSQTPARAAGIAEVERRAAERGLPPIHWPEPWPNDGLLAMRVAVLAEDRGRGREFALAAMRVQFVQGRPLSDPEVLAGVARAAGLPVDAIDAAGRPEVKHWLRTRTEEALAVGVSGVPTVACEDGKLFWGDDQLEAAARHIDALASDATRG
jgi:2-hydroxychromene-2-carboxylate isomerase